MSRQDRKAWQAEIDADPDLNAAWNGFLGQLDQTSPLVMKPGHLDKNELEAAAQGIVDLRAAAQRIYAVAGLSPEDEEGREDD